MASVLELYPSDALLWLEFGGIYTDSAGNRCIDNLALRGDAPARVTCGAGAACPTQLSGRRGVSFDGGDYIDCGLVDRFERTDRFTLFTVSQVATASASSILISNGDEANSYRGVHLFSDVNESLGVYVINTIVTNRISATATTLNTLRQLTSACVTYDGTSTSAGTLLYSGGVPMAATYGNNLSSTILSGKPFLLGARHNGASKIAFITGTMHFAAIFPLAASPLQIANLHKRVMRRINLP